MHITYMVENKNHVLLGLKWEIKIKLVITD